MPPEILPASPETQRERRPSSEDLARLREQQSARRELARSERAMDQEAAEFAVHFFSAMIEKSRDNAFQAMAPHERMHEAMLQAYPRFAEELKRTYPELSDDLIAGKIMHAYARVLEDKDLNPLTRQRELEAADLEIKARIARSKIAGTISAERPSIPVSAQPEIRFAPSSHTSADFSKVASTRARLAAQRASGQAAPSSAGFSLDQLERQDAKQQISRISDEDVDQAFGNLQAGNPVQEPVKRDRLH